MKAVTAAIIQSGDRFLIARRAPGEKLAGFWEFPGGKIESGETASQGLVRELQEEVGITPLTYTALKEVPYDYDTKKVLLKVLTLLKPEFSDSLARLSLSKKPSSNKVIA